MLTDTEKDAILTLAGFYLTCNNQCKTCEIGQKYRLCIAEVAYLDKKRLEL